MCRAGFAIMTCDSHQSFAGLARPACDEYARHDLSSHGIKYFVTAPRLGSLVSDIPARATGQAYQLVVHIADSKDQSIDIEVSSFVGGLCRSATVASDQDVVRDLQPRDASIRARNDFNWRTEKPELQSCIYHRLIRILHQTRERFLRHFADILPDSR